MSDELVYLGFTIRVETYQLSSGGWTFEGVLIDNGKQYPRHIRFYLAGTTNRREAAVEIILAEGRRLIDFRSQPQKPTAGTPASKQDIPKDAPPGATSQASGERAPD